ncbi:Angiomotin like [Actinidia chinensis var. chinensis]|uniref:Angiomotin like n=1 Tax=Actinidia chinensis var. chinensis TaxID=1590841 RepID=A0A2R6QVQ1_ACTCC|nr:Angiomotin like [Actinidia chinensis var. chinensis]
MDDSIRVFGKALASFCNDLQRSCDALKQSVDRRPIPLDSASSTFVQCLNRRVSSTSSDLNMLESMSFGTVSFEELLGYCNEVYKKNQSDLAELEDRLGSFGYVPEPDIDEEDVASDDSNVGLGFELKMVDADPLLEDSLSLKDLGLSDVCLATIASEANKNVDSLDISVPELMNPCNENQHGMKGQYRPAPKFLDMTAGEVEDDLKSVGVPQSVINISKDDYENLPSYMKTLASWEDLLAAVEKMNSIMSQKKITKGGSFFHQDDLASMDLGHKGRSYLLLLLRMNRLVVETVDGLISYRVL